MKERERDREREREKEIRVWKGYIKAGQVKGDDFTCCRGAVNSC
jgi:hypothetical protein